MEWMGMKFSTCLTPSWIKEWNNQKKQGFLTQTRISPHSPGRIISSPQTHLTSYHKNHKVIKSNHQHLCHKQGLRTTIPPPMIITPYQLPHKTSNSASFLPEPEMVPCDHGMYDLPQLLLVDLRGSPSDTTCTSASPRNCPRISIPHTPG